MGDVVIATIALVIALATVGNAQWPDQRAITVTIAVVAISITYTIGSEHMNATVRQYRS